MTPTRLPQRDRSKTGVAEYCRNLGPMYYGLAKEQADPRPWSPALVEVIQKRVVGADAAGGNSVRTAWARHLLGPTQSIQAQQGFVTPTVADVSFVGKMADGDLVRSPPIPA